MTLSVDYLRPPWPGEPTAAAYKDWLHFNVVDHESGAAGILNVSLQGAPDHPAARAVGTALVEVPGSGWLGDVVVRDFTEAVPGRLSLALDEVAIGVDTGSGTVAASARLPHQGLTMRVHATAAVGNATVPQQRVPLGSGWFGWYAIPRLAVSGQLRAGTLHSDLADASAYADHSWGRWQWGDDLGWEWGCFLSREPGPALMLSRVTDRAHRRTGPPALEVRLRGRAKRFAGAAMAVRWGPPEVLPSRRLPGAAAALHADRAASRQPASLHVVADDGRDCAAVRFVTRAAAQIVLGDPARRGWSFLNELVGSFRCSGRIRGEDVDAHGLAVVERVE
jgi:hypothetical protein